MQKKFILQSAMAGLLLAVSMTSHGDEASNGNSPDYKVSAQVSAIYQKMIKDNQVQRGLDFLKGDQARKVKEQIKIAEIPAPPFKEDKRAAYMKQQLQQLGLSDVTMDSEGNVYGTHKGTGNGPTLYVTAHMDSVFDLTQIKVQDKDGILYAPGIGDDASGLAAVLSLVRAFNDSGVQTQGDIIFGGNVGEEELGDLRGMKAFFKEHDNIDGFISIDGDTPTNITYLATGSHIYKMTFTGPGGHSYGAFGLPNPINAMGRAISQISDIKTPSDPKTTFNVGVVEGGTSATAISSEASMLIDIRSSATGNLQQLDDQVQAIAQKAVDDENKRWGYTRDNGVNIKVEQVGDRPGGTQDPMANNVQAAWAATQVLGLTPKLGAASSTDSNQAISLGIPALTLGAGGEWGKIHSVDEWYDPTDSYLGAQKVFLTIIGLVGVQGEQPPLLEKK